MAGILGGVVSFESQGCYVVTASSPWILSAGSFKRLKIAASQAPDLSIDPRRKVLMLLNSSSTRRKSFIITVDHVCLDKIGRPLRRGRSQGNDFKKKECTTFLAVLPPNSVIEICRVRVARLAEVSIASDVHYVDEHPMTTASYPHQVAFPLVGGPFLCTQGINGALTHFQLGTYHAIDFACPVGTKVLAVGDGEVVQVQQQNTANGIDVSNLFHWNSIMLKLDQGLLVEYVHIRAGSATVHEGARVRCGQVICESGDVGFTPEPHLHLQCHVSAAATAPTVPFQFTSSTAGPYTPIAGHWYCADGPVDNTSLAQSNPEEDASGQDREAINDLNDDDDGAWSSCSSDGANETGSQPA